MKKYYKDRECVHFYAVEEDGSALHVLCNGSKTIKHTQHGHTMQLTSTLTPGSYLINNLTYWMQRKDVLACSEEEFNEALNTAIFELGIYSSSESCGASGRMSQRMRMHLRSPKYAGVRSHAVNHMKKILGK